MEKSTFDLCFWFVKLSSLYVHVVILQRRVIPISFWNLFIAVHFHRLRQRSHTKRFEARTFLSIVRLIYRSNLIVDSHKITIDQFLWSGSTFINFSVSKFYLAVVVRCLLRWLHHQYQFCEVFSFGIRFVLARGQLPAVGKFSSKQTRKDRRTLKVAVRVFGRSFELNLGSLV